MSQQKSAEGQPSKLVKTQSLARTAEHGGQKNASVPIIAPMPLSGLSQAAVQRAQADRRDLASSDIRHLQRAVGNQAVLRMLNAQAKPTLQRDTQDGFEAGKEFESQLSRSKGGGAPLPKKARESFESSFGANFGDVRIHTDGVANQLSHSIQAKAFTHGNDIHFGAGEYNPASSQGKHLLAHELTHTIQQGGSKPAKSVQPKLQIGAANDRYEREADRVATHVSQPQHQHSLQMATSQTTRFGSRIQREPEDDPPATKTQTEPAGQTKPTEQTHPIEKNDKAGGDEAGTKTAVVNETPAPAKKKRLKAVVAVGTPGANRDAAVKSVAPSAASYLHVNRSTMAAAGFDTAAITAADVKSATAARSTKNRAETTIKGLPGVLAKNTALLAEYTKEFEEFAAVEAKAKQAAIEAEAAAEAAEAAKDPSAATKRAAASKAKDAVTNAEYDTQRLAVSVKSTAKTIADQPAAAAAAAEARDTAIQAATEAAQTAKDSQAAQAVQDAAQATAQAAPGHKQRNLLYESTDEKTFSDYRNRLVAIKEQGYSITLVMSYSKADEVPTFQKLLGTLQLAVHGKNRNLDYSDDAFIFDGTVAEGAGPKLVWQKGKGVGRRISDQQKKYIENSLTTNNKTRNKPSTPSISSAESSEITAPNNEYLKAGGADLWRDGMAPIASPDLTQITESLQKFNEFRAGKLGNAEEQAKLLFGLEEKLNALSDLKQEPQKTAASKLKQEVDNELRTYPIQPNKVSADEKIAEMERVGFTKKFFAKGATLNLDLLYEAHAALSYKRLDAAQEAFDRLNPVIRDNEGALESGGAYLDRGHNAYFYAQNVLTVYHHEAVGGTLARIVKTGMSGTGETGQGANDSPEKIKKGDSEITPEETKAIFEYSTQSYSQINGALQDYRLTNQEEHKNAKQYLSTAELAQSGLSKLPGYQGRMLYRGDTNYGGLSQFAQVGTTFRIPILMSTTKGDFVATDKPTITWGIKVAPGSRGKDISRLSNSGGENEVLFPVGTKMKILDIYRIDPAYAYIGSKKEAQMYHSELTGAEPTGEVLAMIENGIMWNAESATVIIVEEQPEGGAKQ